MSKAACPFCKQDAHIEESIDLASVKNVKCDICGCFSLNYGLFLKLEKIKLNPNLLNCVQENIKTNDSSKITTLWMNDDSPPVSPEVQKRYSHISIFENHYNIQVFHSNKITEILLLLGKKSAQQHPFDLVTFDLKELYSLRIIDAEEFEFWMRAMKDEGLVKFSEYIGMQLEDIAPQITPYGWQRLEELTKSSSANSRKVFIAMQFNWGEELNATKNAYVEAVKAGCTDCGYQASIVTEHHTGHIVDKIISEIKEAKFIITDFTFNNRGAYFEAGYARALGKHVIHTVMDGHTDGDDKEGKKLHFDIQQINYIKWTDPSELREKIRDRIKAVID